MRKRLNGPMSRFATDTQFGGLPGGTTTISTHLIRMFQAWMHAKKMSHAVLFVDMASAFYTVIRQLAMPLDSSDEHMAWLFAQLKLPADALQELERQLAEKSVIEKAEVGEHLAEMVTEAHSGTYFCMDGFEEVVQTSTGTRPGDPYGDIVFNFVMAQLVKGIRCDLEARDIGVSLPWTSKKSPFPAEYTEETRGSIDPTFVDDYALLRTDAKGEALLQQVETATAIVHRTIRGIAMQLNYKPEKAAAMIRFAGQNRNVLTKMVMIEQKAWLTVEVGDEGVVRLPIV